MKHEITIAATRRGNLARRIVRLGQKLPAVRRRDRVALGRIYRSTLSARHTFPTRVEASWIDLKTARIEVLNRTDGVLAAGAVLHLHGGAYTSGYNDTYRRAALELFDRTGLTVYSPDYRLAPAHQYPAALDDAVAAYRRILSDGVPGGRIAVVGDSAGGGLALSLVMRLRELRIPLPAAVVAFSAWTDLTMSGSSMVENAGRDPMFGTGSEPLHPEFYAGPLPLDHPLVSPRFGTYEAFPPLLLHVGGFEVILSDTTTVADKADAAGADVVTMVYEGMFHGFQLGFGLVPEAKRAWSATGDFIRSKIGAPATARIGKATRKDMMKSKDWFKLDNAAKIFPAVSTKKETNTFRIQIVLTDPVDPTLLQQAVDAALERYPLFKVRLKNGFFWKYFDYNEAPFVIRPLPHGVCGSLSPKEHNGYLFQIYHRGSMIVLEMFHSLADGSGAIMFMKSILYEYLTMTGKRITPDNMILTRDSKPTKAEYEDSQATYYDPKNHGHVKEKKAFFIKGTPIPDGFTGLIAGTLPTDKVVALARSRQATVTEYLSALMMHVIYVTQIQYREHLKENQKPVKIFVPVNLRKHFPSQTLRNFSIFVKSDMRMDRSDITFDEILELVKRQFAAGMAKSELQRKMSENYHFEKNVFLRATPYVLKRFALKIGYAIMGLSLNTLSLSNMGRFEVPPSMEPYIESVSCAVYSGKYNTLNLGIMSIRDKFKITFTRSILETNVEREFFRHFTARGIEVELESNFVEEYL